ncbi:metal ABC transporter permease [Bengtsoniella intestinalis]|uniref:metal ABC transporter permease n=1 Tax=Bengtsoniella intestinalis TaxID=3073143 RepID=UPI00391EF750
MELLWNYTVQVVALGAGLLGGICGVLGCFAVLRKESLLGDGVSHGALSGVVGAFLLLGYQQTEVLLLGAMISAVAVAWLIHLVVRHSAIAFDSALALMLSAFFGLGLVLLTYAQSLPNANQAGLNRFLLGQAATLLQRDVALIAISGGVLLVAVVAYWKVWKLLCFDVTFGQSVGYPMERMSLWLSLMLVVAMVIGLQAVGVVLMSALLVAPAVAARQWCHHLWSMVVLSGVFGSVSGVLGTAISTYVPSLPTGATIVLCVSVIALFSVLFAPQRGVVRGLIQYHELRRAYGKQVKS